MAAMGFAGMGLGAPPLLQKTAVSPNAETTAVAGLWPAAAVAGAGALLSAARSLAGLARV